MNPIDYFVSYYGAKSFKDIVLSWDGSGTTFTLYQVGNPTPVYTGSGKTYSLTTTPNTRTDFLLETVDTGITYSATVMTYTTVLLAPTGLAATVVDDTTATLSWNATSGVDGYEIGDVTDSYAVVHTTTSDSWSPTGLSPTTRYSYAIRTVYGADRSRWSAPVTFFTTASPSTPGEYQFIPDTVYVWADGRPGSTNPQWLSASSNWFAGDGVAWGDNNGIQTTYFFYGSPPQFTALAGSTCTRIEVYLDRNGPAGDPGVVLSQWGLHRYYTKPVGAPEAPASTSDVGSYARGQYGWVQLPTAWGQTLIDNTWAFGIAWGGTTERYQSVLKSDYLSLPATGTLRITVS